MASPDRPAPRLFGIPASEAPIVAVLRRGPSDWSHVGKWDVERGRYEPGAWFKGTIYPQKCDLSGDGRWLAYSALKHPAEWPAGSIYEAVSRLPWLVALAAWNAGTTYTRGVHFTDDVGRCDLGDPDTGTADPVLSRYGLAATAPAQFAVERRHGWTESADSPPRETGGAWDDSREVTMVKTRPGDTAMALHARGGYAAFRTMPDWYRAAEYRLVTGGSATALPDAQWADWDEHGRLLVATTGGGLEIRELSSGSWTTVFHEDLAHLTPDPQPAPTWAHEW